MEKKESKNVRLKGNRSTRWFGERERMRARSVGWPGNLGNEAVGNFRNPVSTKKKRKSITKSIRRELCQKN